MKPIISRRNFLSSAAAALAAPLIVPSRVLGREGTIPPSDRIGVGFIGCGAMNTGHARRYMDRDDAHIIAVCDVNERKREELRENVETRYAQRFEKDSYRSITTYLDFRDLIADDGVDAVVIATPDHWHVLPALAAVRQGKDVYLEKPMSLTIEEGRVLADEVKRTGAILQHGAQQRSQRQFFRAVELVRNGKIGELEEIDVVLFPGHAGGSCTQEEPPEWFDYDLWLGPAPESPYCPEKCLPVRGWMYLSDYSGGRITEWGSHHLDIAQWALDADETGPVEIEGSGVIPQDGTRDTPIRWDLELRYPSGVTVKFTDSTGRDEPWIRHEGAAGGAGIFFKGSEGWVSANRARMETGPGELADWEPGPDDVRLGTGQAHHENFLECIRSRQQPAGHAESAHRSSTMCHLAHICVRLGEKLEWDPEHERFVDNPEADKHISRRMREPWSLEEA